MEPLNPADPNLIHHLAKVASDATSMNAAAREYAEQQIKYYQQNIDQQTGFTGLLLHVASSDLPAAAFCSIVLKNTVKSCWDPSTAEHCVQDADKTFLRDHIIGLMLQAPPAIQRNLAETIAIVAEIDFPLAWPGALNLIVQTLSTEDTPAAVCCAALSTAHSILVKYRSQAEMSEAFVSELRIIYKTLLAPLLRTMGYLLDAVERTDTAAEAKTACKGLVSAVEVIQDLTSLDLGDEFIWSMNSIVGLFLRCLALQSAFLVGSRDAGGVLVELKSVVTSCVTHFLNNFDEDFERYANQFLAVVWEMVAAPNSSAPALDDLIIRGIELLSSACRGTTRAMFDNNEVLLNLVQQVILPNLALQVEDVEMYTAEPDAYIQKDIEGSDLHTRRRAAGELVRTLMVTLPIKAGPLLSAKVSELFVMAAADWKAKDTAIYLASSLALEGQHADAQRGATQRLSSLISFESFLTDSVLPELASPTSAVSPAIIKSDCIRVVATFRSHIPPVLFPNLLSVLTVWLGSDDPVVLTYAAHAVERLLLVQSPAASQSSTQYVITEDMFSTFAASVLQSLCLRVQQSEQPNAYLVQCLMRICQRLPGSIAQYVGDVVMSMNAVLGPAAKNPSNPLFSHCMFEVLSKCIAISPQQGPSIEGVLWENFMFILTNDVLEYIPYVLQILAQLLDTHVPREAQPPPQYCPLLEPLTLPGMYEQRGSIPAIVRLLMAFVEGYPSYVQGLGLTEKILNIFRFLLQLKNYDHEGLNLLTALLLSYPPEAINPYMNTALQLLLHRLQTSRTPKYVRILIIFLSVAVVVRGAQDIVTRMEGIQKGLFFMLLEKVWLPNMQKITGAGERKVCVVALAKLLCDSAQLQSNQQAWASCVFSCLKMIHAGAENDDYTSFSPVSQTAEHLAQHQAMETGLSNVFCPLQEAVRRPVDVCSDTSNHDQYFRERMSQLLRGDGASLIGVLQASLTPDLLALIQ